MKILWAVVLTLILQLSCLAESMENKVWATGSVVYGQATLSNPVMATHTLTTKVRFVNSSTGAALTNWVTKSTIGATNVNKISISRPSATGQYALQVEYNVACPKGQYNLNEFRFTLFLVGYSLDCLYLVPATQQLVTKPDGTKYWYGLYSMAVGCNVHCPIANNTGFTTPYEYGRASANIQIRYWWVSVFWGSTYCLDAYIANRNSCSSANCGDFAVY